MIHPHKLLENLKKVWCKPQQKPLIEYMNGEFRHWFKKGTDFNPVMQQEIDWVVNVINGKLRPILNWRTFKEVFLENFR